MSSHPTKKIAALIVALLIGAGLIAGCGGDDDAPDDPQSVLDQAFSSEAAINSGVLDANFQLETKGEQGGKLDASLSGPFQSTGPDQIPMLGLTAQAKGNPGGDKLDASAGVTITEDAAFLNVDGKDYAVDDATYSLIKNAYAQSVAAQEEAGADEGSAALEQLGISPEGWLTNVTDEGTEEINGVETTHISGDADVAQILSDSQQLAQQGAQAAGVDPNDIAMLEQSVESSRIDVFVGTDDGILRRFEGSLSINDSQSENADVSQVDITFSVDLSDVNNDQQFEPPANPLPLSELEGLGGIGGLGGIAGGGAPTPGAGAGGAPAPDAGAGGAPAPGAGGGGGAAPGGGQGGGGGGGLGADPNAAYGQCLQQATTPEEIQECAQLQPGAQPGG